MPTGAAAIKAASEISTKASKAKAALKIKLNAERVKTKEKSHKKLAALTKRKNARLKKQKEGAYKRSVATITLKNTGVSHLKRVIKRGSFRVQDRLLKADRKIHRAVGESVRKMQESPVGHTAIKAARALREIARAPLLKYKAWKASREEHFKDTAEKAQKLDIEHSYKSTYKVMDAADIYRDARQRIHDDSEASAQRAAQELGAKARRSNQKVKKLKAAMKAVKGAHDALISVTKN